MGRPRPMPRALVVQKGEKILSFRSAEMPLPLSCTVTTTPLVSSPSRTSLRETVTLPFAWPRVASAAFATKLGEGLDRDERVAHFVRHARREVRPKGGAIRQLLFLPERFLRRHVLDHRDRA